MPSTPRGRVKAAILALLSVLAAIAVTIAATSSDDGHGHRTRSVTVHVGPGAPPVVVPAVGKTVELGGPGRDTVKVTPPVQAAAVAAASNGEQALRGAEPPAGTQLLRPPLATAYQRGCGTALVRNYSYRNAAIRPRIAVLHYTVSPRITGPGDVRGIAVYFDRSAAQASSNYTLDQEGNCLLMVPEALKAWAQASFNSATACSFEVINTGHYGDYDGPADGPGIKKLAMVLSDCLARWSIPVQAGAVSGSSVTRPGIVTHADLGYAGGGHHDIEPYTAGPIIRAVQRFRATAAHVSGPQTPKVTRPGCQPSTRQIQAALNHHGAHLVVDGQNGPATRAAIVVFKLAHKLPGDPHVGRRTGRALGVCA